MDASTLVGAAVLLVGIVGLGLCAAVMSQTLPDDLLARSRRWWGTRHGGAERGAGPDAPGPVSPGRRVVTGAPAAMRREMDGRPTGHPAMRPDVLRREREQLTADQAREVIEQYADDDPRRLAEVVDRLLIDDRTNDQRHER